MSRQILIAGGGAAALEAVLALRLLAGDRVDIGLLSPWRRFERRPASVASPFGFGLQPTLSLEQLLADQAVTLHDGALAAVDPEAKVAVLEGGERLSYDELVIAVGAQLRPALPGALTFTGPSDVQALQALVLDVERGRRRRVAFVLPTAQRWALPLYELALMTAVELRDRGIDDAELSVITCEREPLWLFGADASETIRRLLRERDIALETDQRVTFTGPGHVTLEGGGIRAADAVVALGEHVGHPLRGLPSDRAGFLPIDRHGRVAGVRDVYAAGDGAAFPIKQGGLATQQADAVASAIAARLGAVEEPEPFRPVLRGLLLTGGAPVYMRAAIRAGAITGETSTRPLWSPPQKVAGRHLAPYLSTARPLGADEPMFDRSTTESQAGDPGELALLVADEDARVGRHGQALRSLDAAARMGAESAQEETRRADWAARA